MEFWAPRVTIPGRRGGPSGRDIGSLYLRYRRWVLLGHVYNVQTFTNTLRDGQARPLRGSVAGFKGLRPPAADPQQNEGMMLRGYENHEAIALVTCAS